MGKPNKAGVDENGYIVENGFFPQGALKKLQSSGGVSPKKAAASKKTSPVTKKGKK